MVDQQSVSCQEQLPIQNISSDVKTIQTDANSAATEGFLGQRVAPDAVSGASAI